MRDATLVAKAGGTSATAIVRVGRHPERLAFQRNGMRFETYPRAGPGSLKYAMPVNDAAFWELAYDFSGAERAAYANAALVLPGVPLAFGIDVRGDGKGAALRVAFLNRFGERRTLTLAVLPSR